MVRVFPLPDRPSGRAQLLVHLPGTDRLAAGFVQLGCGLPPPIERVDTLVEIGNKKRSSSLQHRDKHDELNDHVDTLSDPPTGYAPEPLQLLP